MKGMNKLFFPMGILLFSAANYTYAGDITIGKKLYEEKCNGCHDTRIHTRPNRIIHTYDDLVNRVKFCDNASKAGFDSKQMEDVTDYLNDAFYKFIKTES